MIEVQFGNLRRFASFHTYDGEGRVKCLDGLKATDAFLINGAAVIKSRLELLLV